MEEKYVLDRIEGIYAILERDNGEMCKISIENIEGSFKEGDILLKEGKYFRANKELTNLQKDKINHIMKDIWE